MIFAHAFSPAWNVTNLRMSGIADLAAERQEEVKRLGADFLIPKPVDVHKLVEALQALQRRA